MALALGNALERHGVDLVDELAQSIFEQNGAENAIGLLKAESQEHAGLQEVEPLEFDHLDLQQNLPKDGRNDVEVAGVMRLQRYRHL